jgi:radical SAM superfamily enzyme YgiQ (UPF0313 family)
MRDETPPENKDSPKKMIKKYLQLKPSAPKRLDLYLIKPSKYDDDGYVIRYWKGVCPSNTLACLNGLSKDVQRRGALGKDVECNIWNIDETVEHIDIQKIARKNGIKGNRTVVCLVGVQSNQFPRASDLALAFRKAGVDVLVGGFHVSGVLAMLPELPSEVRELQEAGVTLVAGEVEGRWEMILRDALEGQLKPVYNFLQEKPDLSSAPMPVFPKNLRNSYAVSHFGTLDCSRGCPYACSFCTVINVQGRTMRFRPVDPILKMIRDNYVQQKISSYFFTDDNFSRNKNWNAIIEGLIRLRREENIPISFMIQVDTQSHRLSGFVSKAAEAGCSQVFIGLESLNEKNLEAAEKKQNKVSDFKNMIAMYHEAGISAHLAYIIGFPFDSDGSVALDMARLREELGAPVASFFMLTPLPGSLDHKTAFLQGRIMDADLNNFDSFHETFRHEQMSSGAWALAYGSAWRSFYGVPHMIRILRQIPAKRYWDIFLKFVWFKNSIEVEGGHPMLDGFFRLKSRKGRRGIYPIEGRWTYFKRRVGDIRRALTGWIKLAMEMEEVWLETRTRGALEERVVLELSRHQKQISDWRNLRVRELQVFYRKAAAYLERSYQGGISSSDQIPSRFQLWLKKRDIFSDSLTFTRRPMNEFWNNVRQHLKQGRLERIRPVRVAFTGLREIVLFSQFFLSISKHSW